MNKEHSEAAAKYARENLNPDPSLIGDISICWPFQKNGQRGYRFYNPRSGEINEIENCRNFPYGVCGNGAKAYSCQTYGIYNAYAKYIPELEMLEISKIIIDGHRAKAGEKREWSFSFRLFLFKGDPDGYRDNGNVFSPSSSGKYYNKNVVWEIQHIGEYNTMNAASFPEKEVSKFFEVGDETSMYSPYCWAGAYKRMLERTKGKTAIKLDKANTLPMKDAEEIAKRHCHVIKKTYGDRSSYGTCWIPAYYFEKLCENYCVIRKFAIRNEGELRETHRIFIADNGRVTIMEKYGSTFNITTKIVNNLSYSSESLFLNYEEAKENCKRIKWLDSILDNEKDKITVLVNALRHPIVEKIAKAGYPNIAKEILCRGTIVANCKRMFGKESKEDSISSATGLNKYALKKIEEMLLRKQDHSGYSITLMPAMIKTLYGKFDITELDEKTTDLIVGGFIEICSYYWSDNPSRWARDFFDCCYGEPRLTEEQRNFIYKLFRISRKEPERGSAIRLYKDVVSTYRNIRGDNRPDVDITDVGCYEDILHLHDNLVDVLNHQREEDRARWDKSAAERLAEVKEKFEKLQPKRIKDFEFELDNFKIICPSSMDDISREGCRLHHCVAGYRERHATGDTTILFLRSKDHIEDSFYTIEVNNGRVIQIHGQYNKWLGNDPSAINCVYWWAKERNIYIDENILTNKASGYGAGNERVKLGDWIKEREEKTA